jgi:hypothetical protein
MRHREEIAVVLADWSDKFSHIWLSRKEDRLRALKERFEEYQERIDELYEHARRETETIRSVDPGAGEVPIELDKSCKIDIQQRRILREAADELGQLMSRAQPEQSAAPMLHHVVEGINLAEALGLTTGTRPAVEPIPAVTPPVDLEGKDTETMREPWRANPPPKSETEPEPELVVEEAVQVASAPVLPDHVTRAARALAQQVYAAGSLLRDRLFAGQNPTAHAETERYLNCAVDMNWVAISGDRSVKGSVSPNPMEALPDERNSHGWASSRA